MHSRQGPGIAVGDVNSDGREDFFVGNGSGARGSIYIQDANGRFVAKQLADLNYADNMGALFFDADNDGDADLYIAAGGSSISRKESAVYKHRLYLNDGLGNLSLSNDALPSTITPAS
jgi:hypothetical protein